jgi:hypothetical protein
VGGREEDAAVREGGKAEWVSEDAALQSDGAVGHGFGGGRRIRPPIV